MYAMTGKLTAAEGQREAFVQILLRAAEVVEQLPGCKAYIVTEDLADEVTIWVFEAWEDEQAHDDSLKDEIVRALIAEAMPLMGGTPDGAELAVRGGFVPFA